MEFFLLAWFAALAICAGISDVIERHLFKD